MKTIVYMRISTEDQSIELQREAIMRYLKYKEVSDYQIYQDEGFTGSNNNRPGFKHMLEALKTGDVDTLIVWKLDRITRSLEDLLGLIKTLKELDIGLYSITENIDATNAIGTMMIQILGVFAQFEKNILAERTKAGMAAKKALGVHCGRKSELSPDMPLRVIRGIEDLGYSYFKVAHDLEITVGQVQYIMKQSREVPNYHLKAQKAFELYKSSTVKQLTKENV